MDLPLDQYYFSRTATPASFFPSRTHDLYTREFQACIDRDWSLAPIGELFRTVGREHRLNQMQYVDIKTWLPDDLLLKADKITMANSLELRVPFLDHRVVEFAAALPPGLKLRGLTKKYILKQTMSRDLPSKVLKGKKRGFNVPIASWLSHELRELVHEALSPRRLKELGVFNPEVVGAMIQEHELKRVDYSRNIWCLLIFMLWHEEYSRCSRVNTQTELKLGSSDLD